MITESEIIPYKVSAIPDGKWLIFAPHPDDETFGMGGSILLARKKGLDVNLVIMTNGEKGGGDNIDGEIINTRNKELEKASELFGLKSVYYLNIADRDVHITDAYKNNVKELIDKIKPDCIFFPSILEPHPDHRATAQLVSHAIDNTNLNCESYSYDISVQSPVNMLVDISQVQKEKNRIMHCYASQLEQNNYIDIVNSLNKARTYTLSNDIKYAEGFYHYTNLGKQCLTEQIYNQLQPFWQPLEYKYTDIISVIIRTYNREQQLNSALYSLCRQSYKKIEVVIVNDGGKDVSSVCNNFKDSFYSIKYFPLEKNLGRSQAANYGLDNATGDYLIFLDDDDYILPEHLLILHKQLTENQQYKAAYTGTKVESPDGDFIMSDPFNISILRYGNFLPIHSVLFSRELLEYVSFDTTLDVYEDWDFWLQLARYTEFLHIKNSNTAVYKATGNSGVGVVSSSTWQRNEKLKVINKWYASWSPEDVLDIYYALEEKNKNALSEHQAVIQENAQRIEFLNNEIDSLKLSNKQLNEINNDLSDANNGLNEINIKFSKDIALLTTENNKLREELNTAEGIKQQLQHELNLIYKSISWKASKPLRVIKKLFTNY